ncbi:semaphorin-4F [Megalops cyprinoides]|uniref:semaphorin-4F n=1 Tax=Megalops cyprinoides TaxID=118141 RepID=UPI001864F4FE|nr:semaphorin-4F [Megalops cyprinoides]XP_036406983.1 semaphorin-4F [Megalops cyprinoides]XP_036406984.1 semaphorin-4F [Megalops cyprinoides]
MKTAAILTVGVHLLCFLSGNWTATLGGYGSDSRLGPLQYPNVSNISTFLMNPSSGILYLGARDAILAVDTSDLSAKHKQIVWDVPEDKRRSCVGKGKTEVDCHNYIRLLEFLDDGRIYACGTYAFDPQCSVINTESFSLETTEEGAVRMETGKGKCPFEPSQHYTAVMADGVLYTATTSNFLGTLFDISRATGSEGERIRTEQSINWLSDPEFVSSAFIQENKHNPAGDDDKIYFFFTEVAKEYDLYTKVKVPRVARVCKGDVGGMKTLQKRWTTFLKAQLVCEDRASGQRYNILTNVYTMEHQQGDPSSTHFYGIFTSQWEREELSAVCVYSLADISKVMAGPFKELKKTCENWMNPEPVPNPRPGQCITSALKAEGFESSLKLPDKVLTYVRDHPLMENSVAAAPLLVRRGITYTRIAVSLTAVSNSDRSAAVLLLGTDRGELHRVSVVGQNATLLQEIPLFTAQEPVNNILLHKDQALVGSPLSLARLPAEGCGLYPSCEVCALARGLGCVWRPKEGACSPALEGSPPGPEDSLKLCDSGEARCSPAVKELRVTEGLHVLLACEQVSPRPCFWEHPPHRHTRQHHSHLEVRVTQDSLGFYTCLCEEAGRDPTPCRRAAYELTLEGPVVGGAVGLGGGRHVLAVYVLFFLAGVVGGAFLLLCFQRRRPAASEPSEKGRDLLPSSDTPQSPSSASLLSEAVPLTEKRNGTLNGHGALYANASGLKLHESAVNLAEELDGRERERAGLGRGDEGRGLEEEIAAALEELPQTPLFKGAPLAQCEESSI